MSIIDRTTADDTTDPQMLVVFLHYALDDVRKLSARSATLLEQAIGALAQEITETATTHRLS